MISILLAALVLGVMIALTNDGEFPPWGILIICLAAAIFPTAVLNFVMPESLFFVAPIVGAICCAITISLTLSMSIGRAAFSAGMYFVSQIGLGFLF